MSMVMAKFYCSVPLCRNYNGKKNLGKISWHSVPKAEKLRKQWLAKIHREVGTNFQITKNTKICSAHFTPSDFRPFLHPKKRFLKIDAIPSIFHWTDTQTNMPSSRKCCVVGCVNSEMKRPLGTRFHRFSTRKYEEKRMAQWIAAINHNRLDGKSDWQPNENSVICSDHFVGGKPVNHPESLAYLPTIFPGQQKIVSNSALKSQRPAILRNLNRNNSTVSKISPESTKGVCAPSLDAKKNESNSVSNESDNVTEVQTRMRTVITKLEVRKENATMSCDLNAEKSIIVPVNKTVFTESKPAITVPKSSSSDHHPVFNAFIIPNNIQPTTNNASSATTFSRLTFNELIPRVTGIPSKPPGPIKIAPATVVELPKNTTQPIVITARVPSNCNLMQLLLTSSETMTSSVISKQLSVTSEMVPSNEQRNQAQSVFIQSKCVGFPESICEQQLLEESVSFNVEPDAAVEQKSPDEPPSVMDVVSHIERTIQKDIVSSSDGHIAENEDHKQVSYLRNERIPRCETCGKVYSSFGAVRRHQLMHSDEKKYKCDICSKTFRWETSWKFHKKTHENHQCSLCGESFSKPNSLRLHIRVNHSEAETALTCDICQTYCSNESEFHLHRSRHGKEKYTCKYCQKSCSDKFSLQDHLLVHTEAKSYGCHMCSSTFKNERALEMHGRRCHRDGMQFECPICKRQFFQNSQMTEHMTIHTAKRPFKCNECRKTYRSRTTLIGHMNNHHGIMLYS